RKQSACLPTAVNLYQRTSAAFIEFNVSAHNFFRRIPAQQFPLEQTVAHYDVTPKSHGTAVIEHYARLAAGPQHAMDLAHSAHSVGRVMQNAVRIHHVETVAGERQSFTVTDRKITRLVIDRQVLPRDFDRAGSQINASHFCAAPCELQK